MYVRSARFVFVVAAADDDAARAGGNAALEPYASFGVLLRTPTVHSFHFSCHSAAVLKLTAPSLALF